MCAVPGPAAAATRQEVRRRQGTCAHIKSSRGAGGSGGRHMCSRPMHSFVLRRSSKRTSASKVQPSVYTALSEGAERAGGNARAHGARSAADSSNNLQRRQTARNEHWPRDNWHLSTHRTVKKVLLLSPKYTFSSNKMPIGAEDAKPCTGYERCCALAGHHIAPAYHCRGERAVTDVKRARVQRDELVRYAGALPHDMRLEVGGGRIQG